MLPETPASSPGSQIGAFFDLDYTLLRGSSGLLYLRYLWQIGYVAWPGWIPILGDVAAYKAGILDFPLVMARLMARVAGSGEAEAWKLSQAWFESMLRHYIADGARQKVEWHQAQGHHTVIVSASTPYAVQPVAHALGLGDDAYLATRLETVDGRFTGRVCMPACYGQGKVTLTRGYAAQHGVDLSQSYFYSDSAHDLPLLDAVGHPVAVNPDRKLVRIARERGWPVMRFY